MRLISIHELMKDYWKDLGINLGYDARKEYQLVSKERIDVVWLHKKKIIKTIEIENENLPKHIDKNIAKCQSVNPTNIVFDCLSKDSYDYVIKKTSQLNNCKVIDRNGWGLPPIVLKKELMLKKSIGYFKTIIVMARNTAQVNIPKVYKEILKLRKGDVVEISIAKEVKDGR